MKKIKTLVMKKAWEIRKATAKEMNVKVSEISISGCLKMAWAEERNTEKVETYTLKELVDNFVEDYNSKHTSSMLVTYYQKGFDIKIQGRAKYDYAKRLTEDDFYHPPVWKIVKNTYDKASYSVQVEIEKFVECDVEKTFNDVKKYTLVHEMARLGMLEQNEYEKSFCKEHPNRRCSDELEYNLHKIGEYYDKIFNTGINEYE